jgi:hypothetical protein
MDRARFYSGRKSNLISIKPYNQSLKQITFSFLCLQDSLLLVPKGNEPSEVLQAAGMSGCCHRNPASPELYINVATFLQHLSKGIYIVKCKQGYKYNYLMRALSQGQTD